MKLKFDHLCICLEELGYDNTKQWWELCKTLERGMKSGFASNDKQKEFEYGQAYTIVSKDCYRISTKCEAEFHKKDSSITLQKEGN